MKTIRYLYAATFIIVFCASCGNNRDAERREGYSYTRCKWSLFDLVYAMYMEEDLVFPIKTNSAGIAFYDMTNMPWCPMTHKSYGCILVVSNGTTYQIVFDVEAHRDRKRMWSMIDTEKGIYDDVGYNLEYLGVEQWSNRLDGLKMNIVKPEQSDVQGARKKDEGIGVRFYQFNNQYRAIPAPP